jgi:ADP-ribose pyrophosphatase YjhB (NUDIX family)
VRIGNIIGLMSADIHPYQRIILKRLMYNPALRFSKLQIEEITSKHLTYHINQLKEQQLIEKVGARYSLTVEGKKYVERFDEANMQLEKQPKVSVVVFPERKSKSGRVQILLNKRTKQPNFGKVVGIGGKVRFGETFEEAARRELAEETGLSGDFRLSGVIRKIGYQVVEGGSHGVVLDILFVLFHVTSVRGTLTKHTADQENIWCNLADIATRKDISETVPMFVKKGREGKMENFETINELIGY